MNTLTAADVAKLARLNLAKSDKFDAWVRFGGSLTKDAYFEAKEDLAEVRANYIANGYDL